MGLLEIIGGVLLIVASIVIIVSVTLQETKGGLGSALAGDNSSFFDKNRGKTKEAVLARATRFSGATLMIVAVLVLAANVYGK